MTPHRMARCLQASLILGAVAALLALSAWAGPIPGAHASSDDSEIDGGLSVEVADDTATPTPTPSTKPPRTGSAVPPRTPSSATGSSASSVATQATIPDAATADDAVTDDPVVVDGVLTMSGLSTSVSPWIDVGNGSVTVSFVVRNISPSPFDSTAVFWVDNAFGGFIAKTGDIAVDDLQPDETRRVQAVFTDLGQHIVLNVNAVLTPPEEVSGTEVAPIGRDVTLFVPPLFSIAVITGIAALSRVGWWAYGRYRWGLPVVVSA